MDRLSPEKRSEVMSSIKSKGTRLECFFADKLGEIDLGHCQRNVEDMIGRPDFVFLDAKIAIFVDSCFWHGCKLHLRMPSSNRSYWVSKIRRNRKKDRDVNRRLREDGWLVLRVWEHSIKNPRSLKWWLTRIKNVVAAREARTKVGRGKRKAI